MTDTNSDDNAVLATSYNWFFTDIVGASDPTITISEQAKKIRMLNRFVEETKIFKECEVQSRIYLSTGDGMFIGFKDNPEKPILLAIELHKSILAYNRSVEESSKINIRIGIDSGPVYFVEDLEKKLSPWGPGIVNARRVMDIGDKMHILVSSNIADDVRNLKAEYAKVMHQIGDYGIKHGHRRSIYNMYGDGFGNKEKPVDTESPIDPRRRFFFSNIELRTDVIDPITMMTHHTWHWGMVNISPEPIGQISYSLYGDTPKNFQDLNVNITDELGNNLEIIELNQEDDKQFRIVVKMKTPFIPNQMGRSLKLEYDWEEPKRNFLYRISSNCKKFKYIFTIPSGTPVKLRVLEVEPEMKDKIRASVPPTIKFNHDTTEMIWESTDLKYPSAYEFQW